MLDWLKKHSRWVTIFVLGVALIAVYKTFDSFSTIVSAFGSVISAFKPFIFAFVIAYVLNIPTTKLQSLLRKKTNIAYIKKHSHGFSVAIVFVVFLALVFLILSTLLPAMYKSLLDMADNFPVFIERTSGWVSNVNERLEGVNISIDLSGIVNGISSWLNSKSVSEFGKYAQGLLSVTSGIFNVVIALIASVYMVLDKKHIIRSAKRFVRLIIKPEKANSVLEQCSNINNIFMQYLYSRFICCIVMAIASSIILSVSGVKYALLLGVFIGFMDLIPYFGSIISWVVSAVVMLISDGALTAFWCSLIMLILQQLDGNVLAPRVMGKRLDIRPLAIIIAVSVGGTLFGFVGMVIAVPVVAIFKTINTEYVLMKEKQMRRDRKQTISDNNKNNA